MVSRLVASHTERCIFLGSDPARIRWGIQIARTAAEKAGRNPDDLSIGAYTLVNTPPNLLRWLQDPQAVKPGCNMPRVPLSLTQQQELVADLEELK